MHISRCRVRLLLMAEGRVAYLGAAKDAIPFFNQYVLFIWRYNRIVTKEFSRLIVFRRVNC